VGKGGEKFGRRAVNASSKGEKTERIMEKQGHERDKPAFFASKWIEGKGVKAVASKDMALGMDHSRGRASPRLWEAKRKKECRCNLKFRLGTKASHQQRLEMLGKNRGHGKLSYALSLPMLEIARQMEKSTDKLNVGELNLDGGIEFPTPKVEENEEKLEV